MATFGLLTRVADGRREYLVKINPEIGSFDKAEIGPSVQWEPSHYLYNDNEVEKLFRKKWESKQDIIVEVVLSEEGGRFYHEQNNNVIIEVNSDEILDLPEDYIWVSYATLNYLVQVNNCLNIQLRNLLSLIKL
jgi:oxidase EvaA